MRFAIRRRLACSMRFVDVLSMVLVARRRVPGGGGSSRLGLRRDAERRVGLPAE
jgi:hypothetical protein